MHQQYAAAAADRLQGNKSEEYCLSGTPFNWMKLTQTMNFAIRGKEKVTNMVR